MKKQEQLKENRILSLQEIAPHPRNYRHHSEKQIQELIASLVRFGQGRSIVVQERQKGYMTVAGHGILEAARRLGYKTIRADILPVDWSDDAVLGYLLADNLHADKSDDNEWVLSELLLEQQQAGYDLQTVGFNEEALQNMLDRLQPPSFDEIAEKYERERQEEENWVTIRLKVPTEVKARFLDLMEGAEGENESERFAFLLSLLDVQEVVL